MNLHIQKSVSIDGSSMGYSSTCPSVRMCWLTRAPGHMASGRLSSRRTLVLVLPSPPLSVARSLIDHSEELRGRLGRPHGRNFRPRGRSVCPRGRPIRQRGWRFLRSDIDQWRAGRHSHAHISPRIRHRSRRAPLLGRDAHTISICVQRRSRSMSQT